MTRRDVVVGGVTALVVGGLTLTTGDRIPANHIAVPTPNVGYHYNVVPDLRPSEAAVPLLDQIRVERGEEGNAQVIVPTSLPGTVRAYDPGYVARALRSCDEYRVERGVDAPRRLEWEAIAGAFKTAGVEVAYP